MKIQKLLTLVCLSICSISLALPATSHAADSAVAPSDQVGGREPAAHSRRSGSEINDPEVDRRILERGPITHGQYITGGVIGSIFGFGIGHGIQHRYAEKGWIFTTSGAVGLGLYIAGLASCTKRNNTNSSDNSQSLDCSGGAATLVASGLLIDVGFHIWEIIDLWVAPPRINRRYQELRGTNSAMIETLRVMPMALKAPQADRSVSVAPGLGFSLQF